MQNVRLIVYLFYMVVACIIRTISKTGNKRVNDKLHNYALPRKKTSLLEFIGATVSEFRFFMRLRTLM